VKFSIIIPYYNEVKHLERCLYSIKICSLYYSYEVIVVDDFSQKSISKKLKKKYSNIKFVRNRKNLGFVRTCNKGASKASGDFLIFLNVDIEIISTGWLYTILNTYKKTKNVGVIGGKLIYPDTKLIQFAGGGIDNEISCSEHIYRFAPSFIPQVNKLREVDMITGAFLTVKKDIFDSLEGFSLDFHSTYEDTDLCLRIKQKGYKIIYQPEIVIYHYETASGLTNVYYNKSKLILQKKWGEYFSGYKREYYTEDGFSQNFIRILLKIFYKDFYNILVVIEEFNLDLPKKQNDFIEKFSTSELLDFLIKYFKGKNVKILSDLHFYSFKYYLNYESKLCLNHSSSCLKFSENCIKKDEIRIFLTLLKDEKFNDRCFYKKKNADIYNILSKLKKGSFEINAKNFLYEKSILILIIRIIRILVNAVPIYKYKVVLDYFLINIETFGNNEDLIAVLFNLSYNVKGNDGYYYLKMAEKITKKYTWTDAINNKFKINLGSYFERNMDYKQAMKYFHDVLNSKQIELSSVYASVNFHLGYCYYMIKKNDEAKLFFEKCLDRMPDHSKSRKFLIKIKESAI